MKDFLPSLISCIILLIGFAVCFRMLFTRKFYAWIIPMVLTVVLLVATVVDLIPLVSSYNPMQIVTVFNPLGLYLFDFLWFLSTVLLCAATEGKSKKQKRRISRKEYEYLKESNRKPLKYYDA